MQLATVQDGGFFFTVQNEARIIMKARQLVCIHYIHIAGIYNCVIRFIIAISDQTINYAIPRNLEKLCKSLVQLQLEYASQVWSPFTNLGKDLCT